ncbi:hypothetical protein Tco_0410701 [Tanacetum coccineum]
MVEESDFAGIRNDPYSRNLEEYKAVFDNEVHGGTMYSWHDEGFKEKELWESGLDEKYYDPLQVTGEQIKVQRNDPEGNGHRRKCPKGDVSTTKKWMLVIILAQDYVGKIVASYSNYDIVITTTGHEFAQEVFQNRSSSLDMKLQLWKATLRGVFCFNSILIFKCHYLNVQ